MSEIRRAFIKIGGEIAVDFANTVSPQGDEAGGLRSWRDLVDFLELRGAVSRGEPIVSGRHGECRTFEIDYDAVR